MLKLFKRFIAYFIDMMVVLIIVQTITSIPTINKNLNKYEEVYNNYLEYTSNYSSFRLDLTKNFEDDELSQDEYNELIEDYPDYKELLNNYYKDDKLTKKNYNNLISKLDSDYKKEYKKIYYKLDKYSILYNVSYLVITILYFVGFNLLTNGVTLGKKLTRLKIVNNKDSNKKVNISSYIIRFIMLYQPIYYLSRLIFINFLNSSNYYNVINVIYTIHTYLEFVILTFMIVRLDGRGLHEIFSNTKVLALDRNGNEIEDKKKAIAN